MVGPVAHAVVFRDVLIELDFIGARIGTHLVVDEFKDLNACLRQTSGLFDSIEEELNESGGIDFLFPPESIPPIP